MALTLRYGPMGLPAEPHEIAKMVGEGWRPHVVTMCEAIFMNDPTALVTQVKEKFGGLVVYMADYTPEIEKIIDNARYKCSVTCESCGAAGDLRMEGWWMTLCDGCYAAQGSSDGD